ncbi:MAG TPA: alpha/beta hydrolase, partial [Isosphaeraceae bacterium]|nr:alpha/beta hydrolase [Isosphaeraceae bacterium]
MSLIACTLGLMLNGGMAAGASEAVIVRVPISAANEVDVAEVVALLAARTGAGVERPEGALRLPIGGLAGTLTQELLHASLGPEVLLSVGPRELLITVPADQLGPEALPRFEGRLKDLAGRAQAEARRRALRYGMHARPSYRPNDPKRPTVCLVHGLNSSAEVFVHMVGPLEAAGFGLVVYEFPYNRDLDETARAFATDWAAFHARQTEKQPWAIVSHSMGALLARWYLEADPAYAADVSTLIMIAPPNQGSNLAHAQTLLQLIQGLKAVKSQQARALAAVSDGLGAAADDMRPSSPFLKALNQHARRAGVRYFTLAGDAGCLTA